MAQGILTIRDSGESDYFYQESMNTLRTNVLLAGRNIKSITVTSTVSGEGKSEISFELARALAQAGKKVLHIDADMRKPAHVGTQKLQRGPVAVSERKCEDRGSSVSHECSASGHDPVR